MFSFSSHSHAGVSSAKSMATTPGPAGPLQMSAHCAQVQVTNKRVVQTRTSWSVQTVMVHILPPVDNAQLISLKKELFRSKQRLTAHSLQPESKLDRLPQMFLQPQSKLDKLQLNQQQVHLPMQVLVHSRADLVNRNLALSDENARLKEVIMTLRQANASLQQRLDGYGHRLHALEQSKVGDGHPDTPLVGVENTTPVGSAHNTTPVGDAHNPTPVGDAHTCPVGDTHSHPVSKANRASQTETQRGSNSLAKPSADATVRRSSAKSPQRPQFQQKKSFKERVEITPSFIPNQAPTPSTKVLLDRSGPAGIRQGVVSPATKPAGDRPQRLTNMKWWRPLSFSGTLEGSGQT